MTVGVVVTTSPRGGAGAPLRASSGTWFVSGVTERGDTTKAVELRGMSDYLRKLGDPAPYDTLYDAATTFFREGGARMYVARTVGPAATVGTMTVKDQSSAPGLNTLRFDAASPGAWSSRITRLISVGNDPNTFRVRILLDGGVVEDYNNLASPAAAVAAFAESVYVRVTDLGSASVAPANNPAADGAPVGFTTQGTDDRASITDTMRVASLALLTKDLGDGAVSVPGSSTNTVYDGIIAHCTATNRIGLLAGPRGQTAQALVSTAAGYANTLGSEYVGLIAPWVLVPDGAGGSKAISPEAFAAAVRNRAHEQEGVWRVPAGQEVADARYLLGVDVPFNDDTADTLDLGRISVIREIANVPTMFGWRSWSSDEVDYYWLKNRDLLNRLSVQGKSVLTRDVFKNVDGRGHLLDAIHTALVGMLEPIRQAGGIYELIGADGTTLIDPGYLVDTGADVNPRESLATQTVNAAIFVRPSPAASLIKLAITEVALTAAV